MKERANRAIASQLELKRSSSVHSFMKKCTETKSYERKAGSGREPRISDLERGLITRAVKNQSQCDSSWHQSRLSNKFHRLILQ